MKIAILADSYLTDESTGVNGTQVQLYQLAHAFAARGHEVHYVCGTRGASGRAPRRDDGIILHYLPERLGMFTWLAEVRGMGRRLAAIAPDAVYQRGRSPLTFAAAQWARRQKRSFVWGSNGEDSGEYFKYCGRLFRSKRSLLRKFGLLADMWLRDFCVHRGLAEARHVVAQTEQQKSRLKTNFGKNAVVLPSYFLAPARPMPAIRDRIVLWLANISPGKQPERFIDIAAALQDIAGSRFVLAGGGSNRALLASLRERAAQVPNLEFAGPVPFTETGALFSRAALHVSTSISEGVPNTFVQSWLHGTPVLTLHQDPNGWIANHGLGYFAGGDIEALIAKAREYLLDPSAVEAMGKRCVRFARETFTDPAVIDTYLRLFSSRTEEAH